MLGIFAEELMQPISLFHLWMKNVRKKQLNCENSIRVERKSLTVVIKEKDLYVTEYEVRH